MSLHRWTRIGVILFGAALAILASSGTSKAEPYTAGEMLAECESVLSSAKATSDPDAIELDNTFSAGTCWGAFLSIQQLASLKKAGAKSPMFRVCVPEDIRLVQIIQVFDVYTRHNADRQNEPFTITAFAALHAAFPCK
jgi:hypothetical protein